MESPHTKQKRNKQVLHSIFSVLLIFVAGFAIGHWQTPFVPATQELLRITSLAPAQTKKLPPTFDLLEQVRSFIASEYVQTDVPEADLIYGAASGMVAALNDPYSVFFTPQIAEEFAKELEGEFQGIGAEIGRKNDQLIVIAPLPDSPAARAGLEARDAILAIDGEETATMSIDAAVALIRGDAGTDVTLAIGRNPDVRKEVVITRSVITVESVRMQVVEHGGIHIGYIEITQFGEDTGAKFQKAVTQLLQKPIDGIVLDLRNNPGGFLDAAVNVADSWVSVGSSIVEERFNAAQHKPPTVYTASKQAVLQGVPTVVLINQGSASGSEIVAGALQDYGLAVLIGEQTFGKGSVQEVYEFGDGSALKITVARWYTPNGRTIDEDGITPDIFVPLTEDNYNHDEDPQLDAAYAELMRLTAGT
ncbi:MAG: hypothetical protein AUK21_03335 [Parcubacteria group bacterium CG2_30_48_51]|nr:MAG: hypothetical protein AUK21_03335 [Parcubacteria group bacterium CG2_30_48_51]